MVIKGGMFSIGVMRPDGSDERLLTRSSLDESPTWAPNGRVIMFSRQDPRSGRRRLFTIDVSGYNEREVADTHGCVGSGLVADAALTG